MTRRNVRATVLVVAAWFFVFSLPLFFLTPDTKASPAPWREHVSRGLGGLVEHAEADPAIRGISCAS